MKLHQYNLLGGLLLPVAIMVSSGLMLELIVIASATMSARRRSEIASTEIEAVLATTLLPNYDNIRSDLIERRDRRQETGIPPRIMTAERAPSQMSCTVVDIGKACRRGI